jgi:hypothetical protein
LPAELDLSRAGQADIDDLEALVRFQRWSISSWLSSGIVFGHFPEIWPSPAFLGSELPQRQLNTTRKPRFESVSAG